MLDVRPVAYVTPIAEQEFASLTPLVRIASAGDEDATLTGLVRIYRVSTGLLIYSSELAITEIMHGTTVDVAALTPWSPPAPADDDYQIVVNTTATSHPPAEWHQLTASLPAYTFDIKPVGMGPAPAAHAPTHENGGSDPLEVETLPTSELDDTLVLAPDGAGGLVFVDLSPTIDHGLTLGLDDDDHPQYQLRHEISECDDFLYPVATTSTRWRTVAIGSGTLAPIAGTATHPGIIRISSSTSTNSGGAIRTEADSILLAGSETATFHFRPQTLVNTTFRLGYHDTNISSAPADGAYINIDPATSLLTGRSMNNSAGSTTGTNYLVVTNTWYIAKIAINADASRIDFYLYDDAGSLLWTDNLTTNIPTAAGRETGHCIIATNSGTTALAILDVDRVALSIPDRRPEV
jgi:predicted outer membrane repeat protein